MASAVLGALSEQLIQELEALTGVEGQVEWIERELRLTQSSLEHVEAMEQPGEDEIKWAGEAREISQKLENVVNIFLSKTTRQSRGAIKRLPFLVFNHMPYRVKLRMEVEKIKVQIRDVSKRRPKTQEGTYGQYSSQAGPSSSQEVQIIHDARTAVASTIDQINAVVSQNLLVHIAAIEGIEHILDEFKRLHGILNDFKLAEELDERTSAWMEQIRDASHFTEKIFASFVNKREEQLRRWRIFKVPFLVIEDFRFGKDIQRISSIIQDLYRRKWTFGIGDLEESPTFMVSLIGRLSSGTLSRTLPYSLDLAYLYSSASYMVDPIPTFFAFGHSNFPKQGRRPLKLSLTLKGAIDEQLESIRGDLRLMQALFKDVDGMEDLDKRVQVWLGEMREIERDLDERVKDWLNKMRESEDDPVAKVPDELVSKAEQDKRTETFRKPRLDYSSGLIARLKIVEKIRRIHDRLYDLSQRKWTYDIGKIEGRRSSPVEDQSQQQQESSTSDAARNRDVGCPGEAQWGSLLRLWEQIVYIFPQLKQHADDLQEKVESIRRELKLMRALFEDVDSMEEEQNARLKFWVEQMRDVAGDAQEFSDSYAAHVERNEFGVLRRHLFTLSANAREIPRIKNRIRKISERKWTYDIGGIRRSRKRQSSEVAPSIPETRCTSTSEAAQPVSVSSHDQMERSRHAFRRFISSLSPGLEDSVESIKEELHLMRALLEDVGAVKRLDGRLKAWVEGIKAVADDADAAIAANVKATEQWWDIAKRAEVADKIRLIMRKIQDISERRMAYGIELNKRREESNTIVRDPHKTPPLSFLTERQDIVGFYDDLQAVMAQLLTDDEHCSIISIVGMDGIGKTTLAELVYEHSAAALYFPCRAWVSIGSNYINVDALLKDIENQLLIRLQEHKRKQMGLQERKKGKNIAEVEPMPTLNAILTGNRYLIVLDDVSTTEVWDRLIKEFPSTLHGSRIVLTTRDIHVAAHAGQKIVPHKLQLLTDDDSWALFKRYLTIPDESLEESRKMVMRCGGLPRAIVKLREHFSGIIPTSGVWSRELRNLILDQKPWQQTLDMIKKGGLPLYLNRCLFYLGRFPAEFEIPLRRLIVLWIAEGLVHRRRGDEDPAESVAERYLGELIDRNMVQVTKKKLNGAVKKCRLPYAIRELWSSEAKKAATPKSRTKNGSNLSPSTSKILHLAHHAEPTDVSFDHVHCAIKDLSSPLLTGYEHVITFRSFDTREGSQSGDELGKFLARCISSRYFLSLLVLDLERVFRPELPKALGELDLLRYLGLRWTYLEILPSFISKLQNLETLDVKHTSISILPNSIWKMEQLRHLYMDESYRCRFVPRPIGYYLTDLQTLWSVFIDEDSPVKDGLDRLINLKRLGVASQLMSSRQEEMLSQLEALANWVEKLEQLQSLRLRSFDKMRRPWYLPMKPLSGHKDLSSIYLQGRIRNRFLMFGLPKGLTELTLSASGLECDPMRTLKNLSNLRILRLFSKSFIGKHMLCSSRSFPMLRVLKLWQLEQLEEWKVRKGALPNLRDLEIRSCAKLKMLPDGLSHLRTLQELKLSDMPVQFTDRIKVNQGEDWNKIEHVRYVYQDANLVDRVDVAEISFGIKSQIRKKLLKSAIYERQKNFLSALASEELPQRSTLATQFPIGSTECPICRAEPESAIHLFFLCQPIKMIWFDKWAIRTEYFSNLSISDWINHVLTPTLIFGDDSPNETDFLRFTVILMENIWLSRNRAISDNVEVDPDMIYHETCSSFMNILSIRVKAELGVQCSPLIRFGRRFGFCKKKGSSKINSGAAFCKGATQALWQHFYESLYGIR